jgi:hypothetical protein
VQAIGLFGRANGGRGGGCGSGGRRLQCAAAPGWGGCGQGSSSVVSCLGPVSWSRMVANGRQHVHVSSVDTTGMIGMP